MEVLNKRQEHKKLFREFVDKVEASVSWKAFLKKNKIDNLKFEVLSECHYKQAVSLLCFQFSMYGNATNHTCLHVSSEDNLLRFRPLVKFAISMGTSMVVLERTTNRVVGVAITRDILEHEQVEQESSNSDTLAAHLVHSLRKQIVAKAILSFPELATYFSKDLKPLNDIKYGQIRYNEVVAVDPAFLAKKLGYVLTFLKLYAVEYMGYEKGYVVASSPTVRHIASMSAKETFPYSVFDYSTFEFDGGHDKIKNMEDAYRQLQTDYGYTAEYVQRLRANSKLALLLLTYIPKWWLGYVSIFPELLPFVREVGPIPSKL
ncbi:hypothetical protein RFI_17074 [Reticulomyxa filosa]|uniref:Uncharacterized protein n=1 Tax=Reticulomyxa filosa TaxID=46433 RepID=X6N1I8_RETFI|nr:hypothetical protein RFI_17074 [Reticulomyxa filosa]|eukprot:ETO20145.1 hypothetical protein RFI_17074 [Reticulomyxa filosa]